MGEDGSARLSFPGTVHSSSSGSSRTVSLVDVVEILWHLRIAMLIEEDWTPDYVAFEAPGQYPEDSPLSGRLDGRAVWPLA